MLDAERFWAAERFLVTERFWWGKNKSLDPHPNVHVPRITAGHACTTPTTVVFGKSVTYFSAVFWCQQSFSTVSTETNVPLIKANRQKSIYPERSVIASMNQNILSWIQTDKTPKNPGFKIRFGSIFK